MKLLHKLLFILKKVTVSCEIGTQATFHTFMMIEIARKTLQDAFYTYMMMKIAEFVHEIIAQIAFHT